VSDLGILRQLDAADANSSLAPSIDSSSGVGSPSIIPRANTFVGTATYMAPERIDGREYSFASTYIANKSANNLLSVNNNFLCTGDIWSLGLTLLTVALGKLPIDTSGGYWTILHSIRDQKAPCLPEDGNFSEEFRDFLALCLRCVN
jgi:serine/threonine protein kinase